MRATLRFSEVTTKVECVPGYYEIWTLKGVLLKVGIAADLCKRLTQHGESLQRGLKGIVNVKTGWVNPSEVRSKRSILAKHLYFDSSIAPRYDLRREADRQKFLEQDCRIRVKQMTRAAAREYEREREGTSCIRYVGRVIKR
jgi:hypothetical protein